MHPNEIVTGYHEATKHHEHRHARSLGYMDWGSQPNPFRRYAGAPKFALSLADPAGGPPCELLYNPQATPCAPLNHDSMGIFLLYALGLAAWKQYGANRWALRCNPSSGNLHPSEGYVICGPAAGLSENPAVYHYAPRDHLLERRRVVSLALWRDLASGFPAGTFFLGLASIHWRESWKYGERAFRYCQHDAGHALGALAFSAAGLGRQVRALQGVPTAILNGLLGTGGPHSVFDEQEGCEPEHADFLAAVFPACGGGEFADTLPGDTLEAISALALEGAANALSREHVEWEIVGAVEAATENAMTNAIPTGPPFGDAQRATASYPPLTARQIIRQRRSAVAMDGRAVMPLDLFARTLWRLLPAGAPAYWSALPGPARIHPVFFVHSVQGLEPGLYILVRSPESQAVLRENMRPDFLWASCGADVGGLPLIRLATGDCRAAAGRIACGQDIASAGVFAVGMLAEFEDALAALGPWAYRRLHWEAGMLGQVLYIEAEAAGMRGTGIGCFYDDLMHELLGVESRTLQTLYHFTVGGPVDDPRLQTHPPYAPETSGTSDDANAATGGRRRA